MDIMEIVGPIGLFLLVIAASAALYFVVTIIKGKRAERREAASGDPSERE